MALVVGHGYLIVLPSLIGSRLNNLTTRGAHMNTKLKVLTLTAALAVSVSPVMAEDWYVYNKNYTNCIVSPSPATVIEYIREQGINTRTKESKATDGSLQVMIEYKNNIGGPLTRVIWRTKAGCLSDLEIFKEMAILTGEIPPDKYR